MKIKNRLYMSAGVSIALVVFLFSLVLVTFSKIAEGSKKHELLDNVRVGVAELDILMYDYLLHREERMEQQWYSKYNSLVEILEKAAKEEELKSIRTDYASLGDLFTKITECSEKTQKLIQEGASQVEINATIEIEERLMAHLLITAHSVITDASRLAEGAQAEVMKAQRQSANSTLILMIILAITVATSSLLVARSISKPLYELTKGAETIGKGDLTHRVEIKTKDELGELTAAFNQMTQNLKASRDELKKEIAEHKQAEEELKRTFKTLRDQTAQLVQSEKMGAVGTMVAGVAHELSNPMMGIINFTQYCLNKTQENDKRFAVLKDIEYETKRCIDIVQNLLTFSRMEKEGEEAFTFMNFDEIIKRVFKLLKYQIEKNNIVFNQNIADNVPKIWMKENSIQQVFFNVISNSLDALKNTKRKKLNIDITKKGDNVQVLIADNGSGILPEKLDKIFDPFYTTKPINKGTGLGLSIVRNIISMHEGEITCESEVGKGTKVIISLPIAKKK